MGEFTKQVRDGVIAGPLRRAFTPEKWEKAFSSTLDPDGADHDILAAGLVLHAKLETVRGVLKLSASTEVSATTKLRAFVAISNYDFFVTRDKTRRAVEKLQKEKETESDEKYAMEELAAVKLGLPGGFDWSPNEVMESLVDGIEIPIRVVLQASPNLAGNPRMNQVDWKEVALELNLGIMYHFAEDLWNDCLWNSYKMIDKGRLKAFLPQDFDVIRGYRVGLARQASLSMAFNMMAGKFQRQALSMGAQLKIREVCGIERQGKRQVIKVSRQGNSTQLIEEVLTLRAYAAEPYYAGLLEEPLETLQGLTLSMLIDAWTVISRAALVLVESIGDKYARRIGNDRPRDWFPEYVPVLQIDALVDALATAIGTNKRNGRQLVEFFIFHGKPGQEIWAQPLVPVGSDTVAPVFAAVVSPNLRRLVDVWLRQAEVDLAKRGPAFEVHVREVAQDAIKRSKILSANAACIEHDYTFKPSSGRDEQIDLLFSIGNTIFVAEAKCILEPTDAKGVAMHRKTVMGAAEQALRKSKCLESNRAQFITEAKRFGMTLTEEFKVVPLIVLSTSTHIGIPAMEVPVVDELILGRFLDGELEEVAVQPGDLSVLKRLKAVFYSNAAEAEERASGYFASPPQMQRFLDGLRGRVIPIHAVNDLDWAGQIVTLDCIPEGVPISLAQQAAPAAGNSSTVPAA